MRQETVFKRCTQCGARIDAKARRCGNCGGDRHTYPTRARALYAELAESGGVRQRCQRCGAPAGTARRDGDGWSVCQADANGRPCGGSEFNAGELSAKSVHNIHRTLSRALSDAVNDGLLPRNPVERCHTMPESPEQQTWSADEVRRFLAHLATDRLVAMWRVAATTGIRGGELVGLRWRDVDLEAGRITIAQQRAKGAGVVAAGPTKTRRSRRLVSLDATTVAALRTHRSAQVEERLRFGAGWVGSGLVFCRPDGSLRVADCDSER